VSISELGKSACLVLRFALRGTPIPEPGKELAHPTDRALQEAADRLNLPADLWRGVCSLPFDPARGYHATPWARRPLNPCSSLCVKDSPEVVLAACAWKQGGRDAAPTRWMVRAREHLDHGPRVRRHPQPAGARGSTSGSGSGCHARGRARRQLGQGHGSDRLSAPLRSHSVPVPGRR